MVSIQSVFNKLFSRWQSEKGTASQFELKDIQNTWDKNVIVNEAAEHLASVVLSQNTDDPKVLVFPIRIADQQKKFVTVLVAAFPARYMPAREVRSEDYTAEQKMAVEINTTMQLLRYENESSHFWFEGLTNRSSISHSKDTSGFITGQKTVALSPTLNETYRINIMQIQDDERGVLEAYLRVFMANRLLGLRDTPSFSGELETRLLEQWLDLKKNGEGYVRSTGKLKVSSSINDAVTRPR